MHFTITLHVIFKFRANSLALIMYLCQAKLYFLYRTVFGIEQKMDTSVINRYCSFSKVFMPGGRSFL